MQPRRQNKTNTTSSLPIIKGSTAKILIELYKTVMHVKNVSSNDAILKSGVLLDAKTTQAKNRVTAPDNIADQRDAMSVSLSRINEVARIRGPQSAVMADAYSIYKPQFDTLNNRTTILKSEQETLLQRYQSMVHEQHEVLADLIQRKPNRSITIADIEKTLSTFEKDIANFVKEKTILEKDFDRAAKLTAKIVETTRTAQMDTLPRPKMPGT